MNLFHLETLSKFVSRFILKAHANTNIIKFKCQNMTSRKENI